jgi:hypothetical protein
MTDQTDSEGCEVDDEPSGAAVAGGMGMDPLKLGSGDSEALGVGVLELVEEVLGANIFWSPPRRS